MLDTEHLYKSAWQKAAAELGYPLDDGFYLTLVGRTNAAGEIALTERFGLDFPLAAFRELWARLWHQEVLAFGIPLKPGLTELLEYLAAQEIPTAIATSSDQEYAAFSLNAAGLDARQFTHIVTGEQVDRGKPAPDIYLEAAHRLGIDPSHCLALEDSDAGILSASAAGMIAVMVPDLKPPSDQARQAAFRILTSLEELAQNGWGAVYSLSVGKVRAPPFALWRNSRKTGGARLFLIGRQGARPALCALEEVVVIQGRIPSGK